MAQRLVIAMSEPGPGHVGGADIKGAAMSGPGAGGWWLVTRCLYPGTDM